nr:hypothetical protein [Endozoicomonas sp.]
MELTFEQSDSDRECFTGLGGLCFVGKALNKNTSPRQALKKIKKRHGISNMDLVLAYIGLLVIMLLMVLRPAAMMTGLKKVWA